MKESHLTPVQFLSPVVSFQRKLKSKKVFDTLRRWSFPRHLIFPSCSLFVTVMLWTWTVAILFFLREREIVFFQVHGTWQRTRILFVFYHCLRGKQFEHEKGRSAAINSNELKWHQIAGKSKAIIQLWSNEEEIKTTRFNLKSFDVLYRERKLRSSPWNGHFIIFFSVSFWAAILHSPFSQAKWEREREREREREDEREKMRDRHIAC